MLWDLVVFKAEDLVEGHREAISRVAVALSYHGTLCGPQVAEIVDLVEGSGQARDRSTA